MRDKAFKILAKLLNVSALNYVLINIVFTLEVEQCRNGVLQFPDPARRTRGHVRNQVHKFNKGARKKNPFLTKASPKEGGGLYLLNST